MIEVQESSHRPLVVGGERLRTLPVRRRIEHELWGGGYVLRTSAHGLLVQFDGLPLPVLVSEGVSTPGTWS